AAKRHTYNLRPRPPSVTREAVWPSGPCSPLRQPIVAVAGGGLGPWQELVLGAPHDPHRAGDLIGIQTPSLAQRVLNQRFGCPAARDAEKLVGMSCVARRRPCGVASIVSACGAATFAESCSVRCERSRSS